ncbi:kinase-like domain-containing protein, partial [Stachybotrys elegans]
SYSSSPRQFPSELPDSILEEGIESGSESLIEPVTPVSGRHSQDFATLQQQEYQNNAVQNDKAITSQPVPQANKPTARPTVLPAQTSAPPPSRGGLTSPTSPIPISQARSVGAADQEPPPVPLSRRSTRGSTSSFKRTMSSFFRRSNSHMAKDMPVFDTASATDFHQPGSASVPNGSVPPPSAGRRYSLNKSSTTTRSNSPPSPGSPLEMAMHPKNHDNGTVPAPDDFEKKTKRSSTGFNLRGRGVNFGTTARPSRAGRRASSFDNGPRGGPYEAPVKQAGNEAHYPPERLPWSLPPDSGTGVKARRMSLSLPDDFTVDVAELLSEFEYQSKILGRHGKHLGKGAASKVTLMARKGCPNELYAVKEFRGKSNSESREEYDKKIKSEFSIAKSLHHPNIVETFRLCTNHSRWNHVMEYCSEGDLFSLVSKGHLKGEDKKKDRLCLFKQLIQGVNYLHANGIAHRDLKLENCLITKDSKLKITDFGVSEVFCGTHPGLRESGGQCGKNMGEIRLCSPGICGSEPYIAPEVLAKKTNYDPRALDVWSSAIIMIYMTFGGAIWSRAERGNTHYDKLADGWEKWYKKHPEESACISDMDYPNCYALDVGVNPPALRRVILQMLNPDPNRRIPIVDVINNRWVKNVECCQMESYDDPTHVIDATKKDAVGKIGNKKIFCHNHLPPKATGSHSLGKMPGQAGY